MICCYFNFIFLYTSLSLFRKFRPSYPGKRYPVLQVHAGSFCVSVIHQTLTRTTGSVMCGHNHSYACVYTQGLGTLTISRQNIFDLEKLSQIFLVLLRVFEPPVLDPESDDLPIEPPRHPQHLLNQLSGRLSNGMDSNFQSRCEEGLSIKCCG